MKNYHGKYINMGHFDLTMFISPWFYCKRKFEKELIQESVSFNK